MAKRKLNRRQQWRIKKIQEDRLARLKRKTENVEPGLQPNQDEEIIGRVIASYGSEFDVETTERQVFRCFARQNIEDIVCGDEVAWRPGDDNKGVIVARLPRRSLLSRPDYHQVIKPVAANIDQIIIVSAIKPQLSTDLIDRYLVAAETVDIPAMILINKSDLLDRETRAELQTTLQVYLDIGYPVLYVNTREADVLQTLIAALRDKTSIFVGQSGVGKSSLIQALLPEQEIRVGELSDATGLGRHTTSVTRLYHFPSGGDLIDSPGVRDFALWNVTPEQITAGFREFHPYLGKCKFNNCSHRVEPDCAIIKAVEQGHIHPRRLQSYYQILDNVKSTWTNPRH